MSEISSEDNVCLGHRYIFVKQPDVVVPQVPVARGKKFPVARAKRMRRMLLHDFRSGEDG